MLSGRKGEVRRKDEEHRRYGKQTRIIEEAEIDVSPDPFRPSDLSEICGTPYAYVQISPRSG